MENNDKPLCFGCASAKFFVWDTSNIIGSDEKRKFSNPDFVVFDDDPNMLCKIKCVFNRMFVTAPAQLVQCPDFETPEAAAEREQRERQRRKKA